MHIFVLERERENMTEKRVHNHFRRKTRERENEQTNSTYLTSK